MVILLIGGECSLMNALIDKLHKDKHRVYLITGKRERTRGYHKVFEKYNFPYDCDGIKEIFESTRPDVVLHMGAYDTNYDWSQARKESVRFTSELTNILSAFCGNKKGRFVYLSSQEVFGKSYPEEVKEEELVSAKSFKAMAVSQGETICKSYENTRGMETAVLRLDHLYGVPKKGKMEDNPCFDMILTAFKTKKIAANSRNEFSMLFQSDAVEFIARLVTAEHLEHDIYHISSGNRITQTELAELVKKNLGEGCEIHDDTVGTGHRLVLDGRRYKEEFGQTIFVGYEMGIKKVAQYMKRHEETFLKTEEYKNQGIGTWHLIKSIILLLVPYVENMICFIPFFMLNNRAVGSQYFDRLDFYLLYVLLFAIVYGQHQAIFSSLLATAGYCFRQMYDQSGFEVLLNYNTYVWMAQLFILGMVVGYMRDQIRFVKNQDEEEIGYLSGQLDDMADINDSNVRMKHMFESQIVNHKDSLGKIYEITSALDRYGPEEVLFYAARTLAQLMDGADVAVYTIADKHYARLFSSTSKAAGKLGNSIEYKNLTEIYEELKEHRVYVNRTLHEGYPMMASAIYEGDKMQIILMIWGIPWERMNLAEVNRLTVVGYLIQNAVVRANRYLNALKEQRYVEGTQILDTEAFTQLVHAFEDAKRNGLTECTLVKIDSDKKLEKKGKKISVLLRQSDYIGTMEDSLYVLLPNTDQKNAVYVVKRIREIGFDSHVVTSEVTA